VTLIEAVVLGIVQGLTEFLPISSTAHLRVIPALFGWADPGAAFSAVIQIGTVVAVLCYFRRDLWEIGVAFLRGLKDRKPFADPRSRMGWFIGAGTIPIVFFGLLFEKSIKSGLRSLWVIAAALVVVGVVMAIADRIAEARRRKGGDEGVNLGDAVVVGVAQACALIPGVSRSGSTLAAGLFRGLSRAEAARFSFLLSVPAVTAAGLKELYELHETGFAGVGSASLVVGTVVSFVVGYFAIAGLLAFLRTRTVTVFVVYRIVLGLGLAAAVAAGILQA
jgi:undecaprenyl-diphosphatase